MLDLSDAERARRVVRQIFPLHVFNRLRVLPDFTQATFRGNEGTEDAELIDKPTP